MIKKTALRRARQELDFTLDDVYVRTGRKVNQSRISKLERNILLPNDRDKKLLSKALKTPVDQLFPDHEATQSGSK